HSTLERSLIHKRGVASFGCGTRASAGSLLSFDEKIGSHCQSVLSVLSVLSVVASTASSLCDIRGANIVRLAELCSSAFPFSHPIPIDPVRDKRRCQAKPSRPGRRCNRNCTSSSRHC